MIARPTDEADYFHVRALEEQAAALRAACPEARNRHDELAAMYRFRESLVRTSPRVSAAARESDEHRPRFLVRCG